MNERGKLINGVRKTKSRSSLTDKDSKIPSPVVLYSKQTNKALPVCYTNTAFSTNGISDTTVRKSHSNSTISLENLCTDIPDVFSVVVENAVERVIKGSLQDLHQDVGQIQRMLSQLGMDWKVLFLV